jgi:septal ring factor EnvC (AmiA/AmiB activator)
MAEESKTLVQQLQEAQNELANAIGTVKTVTAERDAARVELATLKTESGKQIAALTAEVEQQKGAVAKSAEALKAEQEAHGKTKGELTAAQERLKNPAFDDAAKKAATGAGIVTGAAVTTEQPLSAQEANAAYVTLTTATERAEFRKKHWKALGIAEEK